MSKLNIKSNEYITVNQMKQVLKALKKYEVKPKRGYYEIWLPVDNKSAKAIDYEVKKQLEGL